MDLAASSAPVAVWIGVGVLLGAAAVLLGGLALALVTRRSPAPGAQPRPDDDLRDDLERFLEFPPGSSPRPAATGDGFVALAPVAPIGSPAGPPPARPDRTPPPAAVAGLACVLLVAAAGLAAAATGDDRPRPAGRSAATAAPSAATPHSELRMRFPGVVLEQRAIGVTATYPVIELGADREGRVVQVTLPTWNCLSPAAPPDPAAAGCVPSRTEHAELRPPGLDLTRDDDGLRLAGTFPTSTRPNGGPPETTGRAYALELVVTAAGEALDDGSREAVGHLRLGEGTARAEGLLHPAP